MSTPEHTAGRRTKVAARDLAHAENVPYDFHLTPSVVLTNRGDYVCVLCLSGAAFECASNAELNNRHDRLNRIILGLADPRITLWQHVVRREESEYPDGTYPPGYARDLNERYSAKVGSERLMANELYLTLVFRPNPWWTGGTLGRLFFARTAEAIDAERRENVAEFDAIVDGLIAALRHYDAERLALYERGGAWFSEPAEFFGYLANGTWERIALAPCRLRFLVGTTRPLFGAETIEIRRAGETSFSAMLGINGYPAETHPLYLDDLLSLPCELVVTQSFTFSRKDAALEQMRTAGVQMENAGDAAVSQRDELPDVADDLASRRTAMGLHHYSVQVKGATLRELNQNVDKVRAVLTDAGIVSAREDLACEAAYWAQLPGNHKHRPRLSLINSRNACGFMPLHNFPLGRRTGNHWGDAVTMLITAAGTPHYLSLHAADPKARNGGNKKDVAHTMFLGPTGSGKTAAAMFVLAMMQKFGLTSVLFSKDRDTEIAVRRFRGKVYRIDPGVPTGWNPFSLDPQTKETLPYLRRLVRRLVSRPMLTQDSVEIDTKPLSVSEEKELDYAVDAVMRLAPENRRLGRVLDYLPKGAESVYERLSKWCHAREAGRKDGTLAWVFDNQVDTLAVNLGSVQTTAFDVTRFLDDPELRTPINMHLFFLTSRLIDGRRLAVWISEFWKALGDAKFAAFCDDMLRTLRKKNGFVALDSNSPGDAINHPISRTLIEQVATLFLFPNPGARKKDYVDGLGLSEREFDIIKTEMPEGSGMFLFKQGHHSVVLKLPLDGMDDDLAVLSARTSNLALMDRLIAQYGEDVDNWFPHFINERGMA
jgi:type IV secretion system protein VirB4